MKIKFWPHLSINERRKIYPHTKLIPIIPTSAFEKWGVDFVNFLSISTKLNRYIIVPTDYFTKWMKPTTVRRDVQRMAMDFIYFNIICKFGCLLEITTNKGFYFVNGLVTTLLKRMFVKH